MKNSDDDGRASSFRKSHRLLSSAQFRHVFDAKRSVSDDVLIMYGAENGLPHNRLGLAVSRKVGNAVVRNRWKRQIREAFRLQQANMPQGLDLIVLPRRGTLPDHKPVFHSVVKLAQRVERRIKSKPANTQREPRKPRWGRGR